MSDDGRALRRGCKPEEEEHPPNSQRNDLELSSTNTPVFPNRNGNVRHGYPTRASLQCCDFFVDVPLSSAGDQGHSSQSTCVRACMQLSAAARLLSISCTSPHVPQRFSSGPRSRDVRAHARSASATFYFLRGPQTQHSRKLVASD